MEEDHVTFSTEPPKTDLVLDLQLQPQPQPPEPEEVGGGDDKKNKVDDDAVDVDSMNPEEEGQKKKRKRPSLPSTSATATTTSGKRKRGRPVGSGKYQQTLASLSGELAETAGGNFAPCEVTVNAGENVVDIISAFSRRCGKAVSIISANGAVSSVLIRRLGSFSNRDASKFEGNFEIVSLSGSYTFVGGNDGKRRHKKGKLTVLLVEATGRVFGGAVAGSLIAAGPINLVMASFKQDINKKTTSRKSAGSSAAAVPSNSSSDTEMDPLEEEAPSMMEGQPSCPSPTSGLLLTLSGNIIPATTTGVSSDNVNIPANQNMSSASVNTSIGLTLQPIPAQRDSEDDDASVKISRGQP